MFNGLETSDCVTGKNFFFEIKIGIRTIGGQGTPSFRNKIAEMCYLYRRTGLWSSAYIFL